MCVWIPDTQVRTPNRPLLWFVRAALFPLTPGRPLMISMLKHMAAYSQEHNRGSDDYAISLHDLHETYLAQCVDRSLAAARNAAPPGAERRSGRRRCRPSVAAVLWGRGAVQRQMRGRRHRSQRRRCGLSCVCGAEVRDRLCRGPRLRCDVLVHGCERLADGACRGWNTPLIELKGALQPSVLEFVELSFGCVTQPPPLLRALST